MAESDHETQRRKAILEAAYHTFGQYGLRKTSMDDIASAVGISRPALYRHYSSKIDIYRALVSKALDSGLAEASSILDAEGPVSQKLYRILEITVLEPHRMVEILPHGEELIGLKQQHAEDIFQDWQEGLHKLLLELFQQEEGTTPELAEAKAGTVGFAVSGLKQRSLKSEEKARHINDLVRAFYGDWGG